jgi:hypothetical protein
LKFAQAFGNQIHVLLRHRLLPQPGGFEGRGALCEVVRQVLLQHRPPSITLRDVA